MFLSSRDQSFMRRAGFGLAPAHPRHAVVAFGVAVFKPERTSIMAKAVAREKAKAEALVAEAQAEMGIAAGPGAEAANGDGAAAHDGIPPADATLTNASQGEEGGGAGAAQADPAEPLLGIDDARVLREMAFDAQCALTPDSLISALAALKEHVDLLVVRQKPLDPDAGLAALPRLAETAAAAVEKNFAEAYPLTNALFEDWRSRHDELPRALRVTSKVDGFRRAGVAHSSKPVDHPLVGLGAEVIALPVVIEKLLGEPMLTVELVGPAEGDD